jgi:hypothetical protein
MLGNTRGVGDAIMLQRQKLQAEACRLKLDLVRTSNMNFLKSLLILHTYTHPKGVPTMPLFQVWERVNNKSNIQP